MDANKGLRLTILRGLVIDDVRQWHDYQILKYCFQNSFISTEEYNSLTMYVDDKSELYRQAIEQDNVIIDMKNLEDDDA